MLDEAINSSDWKKLCVPGRRLTHEEANELLNRALILIDHTMEYNLKESRAQIQQYLDFVKNNFFGPENVALTKELAQEKPSLYYGGIDV